MLGDMMMGRKMGMMVGGGMGGGGQVQATGMTPVNMNLGVQPNYWQGNQLQIPGLAQMLQRFAPQQPPMMQQQQAPLSPFAEMLKRMGPNGRVPMIGNEFLRYMQQR